MGEQGQGRRAHGKLATTNLLPTSFCSSSDHPWPYMASPSADSVQLSFGLLYVPPHRIISFFVHWATACTRGTSGLKRPLCPCIIILLLASCLLVHAPFSLAGCKSPRVLASCFLVHAPFSLAMVGCKSPHVQEGGDGFRPPNICPCGRGLNPLASWVEGLSATEFAQERA